MADTTTILVIDDSATIRRLVDSTLSRDGYSVILAPNAEDGIEMAGEHRPDMILLDHQLPGTTGFDVCQILIADPELSKIPVVISSTLRKRAYVEYADLSNVVDMLPKPYTEELLLTTVGNALDTGQMIVSSQADGTAIPEVINQQGESDLSGTFQGFSIREVIDFLNNGKKNGTLEIEGQHKRYSIYLNAGRVIGIASTGVPAEEVVDRLPESLNELAPVLNVTMGRSGAALESILDLLNTEVLDPRLLRKLLRHQAAVLLVNCFGEELKSFRFDGRKEVPSLFERLPLDVSVLALLVEGAITRRADELPEISGSESFSRRPIRGQNLDRAGLTAKQSMVLGQLTSARTLSELGEAIDGSNSELRAVLYGFELAELIECSGGGGESPRRVVVYESEAAVANAIKKAFDGHSGYEMTVVNDATAARLVARRTSPDVVVVDATDLQVFGELRAAVTSDRTLWVATNDDGTVPKGASVAIERPFGPEKLLEVLGRSDCSDGLVNDTAEQNLCTT